MAPDEYDFAADQRPPDIEAVLSGSPPGPEKVRQANADAQAAMARQDDREGEGDWDEDENGWSQQFHDWANEGMEKRRARRRTHAMTVDELRAWAVHWQDAHPGFGPANYLDAFRDADGELVESEEFVCTATRFELLTHLEAADITLPCDLNMEDDWARNIARLPAGMELTRGDRVVAGRPGFHSPAIVQEVEEVDVHRWVYVRQLHLLEPGDAGWEGHHG